MLIEQDNGKHIDIDNISELIYDEILFDATNPGRIGKFVILVVFKNNETSYLTNTFQYREQAKCWIDEIITIHEFSESLKNYKL